MVGVLNVIGMSSVVRRGMLLISLSRMRVVFGFALTGMGDDLYLYVVRAFSTSKPDGKSFSNTGTRLLMENLWSGRTYAVPSLSLKG